MFDRLPQSVSKASENSELSRITFVFETTCSANCTFSFLAVRICVRVNVRNGRLGTTLDAHHRSVFVCLQGYNQWLNDVVEWWRGSQPKQSYSYLIQKNITNSFTWSFQRTGENSEVGCGHTTRAGLKCFRECSCHPSCCLSGEKTQQ